MQVEVSIMFTLYNKAFEIEEAVYKIQSILSENFISYEIILCNDGSRDETENICKRIKESVSNIKFISYSKNKGRGYAIKKSIKECIGKKILYMDSDIYKTTDLKIIIDSINILNSFPVVIGNRFHKKSNSKRRFIRNLLGVSYRAFVRILFHRIYLSDCEVGFKCFNSAILKKYAPLCIEDRWSFDLELIWVLLKNNVKIVELPMSWNECYKNYNSSVCLFKDSISQFIGFFKILFRHM